MNLPENSNKTPIYHAKCKTLLGYYSEVIKTGDIFMAKKYFRLDGTQPTGGIINEYCPVCKTYGSDLTRKND